VKPATRMARNENGEYTELSTRRKYSFTDLYMVTQPVDPEDEVENWPNTVKKHTYLPIFPLPERMDILTNEMSIVMRVYSSFEEYTGDYRKYTEFEGQCMSVSGALNYLEHPDIIDEQTKNRYKGLTNIFSNMSITDRGFQRGSKFGDCFDVNFYNSTRPATITDAMFGTGDVTRVPDVVTREFLVDVVNYVAKEAYVKPHVSNKAYVEWHNNYIRRAVCQELVRAFVRRFRYISRFTELQELSEWANEQPSRSADEIWSKAETSAFGLLRKAPWWFLWAVFVGYASVIRFPENREKLRTRLSLLDPPVWPLPAEGDLVGPHKADDPVEPTLPAADPDPPPAAAPASAPLANKVYRDKRKRALF